MFYGIFPFKISKMGTCYYVGNLCEISCLPNKTGLCYSQQPKLGEKKKSSPYLLLQDNLCRNIIFWYKQSFLKQNTKCNHKEKHDILYYIKIKSVY